jgi:MFS family permease
MPSVGVKGPRAEAETGGDGSPLDAIGGATVDPAAPPPAAGPGPWSPALRPLTVGLLLMVVGVAFEALAISTVMPLVLADLGRPDLYGWVFSAFLLTNLIGIVLGGLHADARGPGAPFLWGTVLFSIGLVVGGFAPSMPLLVAARALQGFGGGGLGSVAYVAVGRAYPDAAKPRMLALLSTGWVVPGLVGPAAAGLIGEALSWHWVFLALAPIPPLAAVLALPQLRAIGGGAARPDARTRVVLAVALSAGAGLLLAGLGQAALLPALGLAVGGLALGLPAARRLLPPGTLRAAPGLPAAIVTQLLLNVALFGVDAFIPLQLVEVRGQPVWVASITLTAISISWTAGSWLQARFAPLGYRRGLIQIGLAITALGSAGMTAMLFPTLPPAWSPLVWGVGGLGIGLAFSTLTLTVLETAAAGQEGEASSSLQVANVLGSGIGTGIGGAFIAVLGGAGGSLRTALLGQYLTMIAVLVLALFVAGRLPARRSPAAS